MNETHVHVSSNDTWESMKRARKLYNIKIVVDDVYSARGRGARLLRLRHCMSCASWWVSVVSMICHVRKSCRCVIGCWRLVRQVRLLFVG